MKYNKFIVHPIPASLMVSSLLSPSAEGYVYIGVGGGSKKNSLANNWNGGKPFPALWYNDIVLWCTGETAGEDMHAHYFVKEDCPILGVIYPPDDKWLENKYHELLEEVDQLKRKIVDLEKEYYDDDSRERERMYRSDY